MYICELPRAKRDSLQRTTGLDIVGMYCIVITYCPKMTVKQSYLKVAERTGMPADKVQKAVEGIMKLAAERIKAGEDFVLADMFVDAGLTTVIPCRNLNRADQDRQNRICLI